MIEKRMAAPFLMGIASNVNVHDLNSMAILFQWV
jgi:hypothetical protein